MDYVLFQFLFVFLVLTPPPLMLCVYLQTFEAALFLEEEGSNMSVFKAKILCMLMLYVVSDKVQCIVHYYLYCTLMTFVKILTPLYLSCLMMTQLLLVHILLLIFCSQANTELTKLYN